MDGEKHLLNQEEAAESAALTVAMVRWLSECGLVNPAQGYDESDLAELRRVHRLIEDLGLDQPAIEVVLRMRQRLLALQSEVRVLQREVRMARRAPRYTTFIDAEWTDLP